MTTSPPGHRTVSPHEWHLVGPDGLPLRYRTIQVIQVIQVIRALRPGLTSYTYRFHRSEASVTVCAEGDCRRAGRGRGPGRGLDRPVLPPPAGGRRDGVPRVRDTFPVAERAAAAVRRAARSPVKHVDIRVGFSAERLPAEVRWCLWDGLTDDAPLRAAERVDLDGHRAVHRFGG